ncbi:Clp protease N-terminal domain-containing protein [Kitasatospora sp. NPDC058162]|uniref:Clp protease N-terminal domain-containing protein n=1 Tax=Kitasatospora sp. NPDC058162 TaxID=3346362 RepID=UPI0036D93500
MFERFTQGARRAVVIAQEEARQLRDDRVGTEHLLLGILERAEEPGAAVLAEAGLDQEAVRQAVRRLRGKGDRQVLASIGVDLDAVREAVEAAFGEGALDAPPEEARKRWGRFRAGGLATGHIPFSRPAKKALELSLREALRLKSKEIGVAHLLLGVLREGEGLGVLVVVDHGLDTAAVRQAVEAGLV